MHGLEGLKHMASSIVPGIYHEKDLDDKIQVGTEECTRWSTRSARPRASWTPILGRGDDRGV